MKKLIIAASCFLLFSSIVPKANAEPTEDLGTLLAKLLISARQSISAHPKLVENAPTAGVNANQILELTRSNFVKNTGTELDEKNEAIAKVMTAIRRVIENAVQGKYKDKWLKDKYPGRFLPARFAREVANEFNKSTNGKYVLRLTTLKKWLVNKKENSPDAWEEAALQKYISGELHPGRAYFEKTTYEGKTAARVLKPEFYERSCLNCHGNGEGVKLHPSKEDGKLNDLGGAVSVVIMQ